MSTPQAQAFRRWVMTGSIAAITATGAWYGAGLKVKQDYKQEKKTRLEATPQSQIEQLESYRFGLVQKKMQLDRKLDELAAKKERRAAKAKQSRPEDVK